MALPSNPQILATYDITKSDSAKIFVKKVSDLFLALSAQFSSGFISGLLNGTASLFNTSLVYVTQGTTSATSFSVECLNAVGVAVSANFTVVAQTLTLLHLAPGVPVTVAISNSSAGPGVFKVAATNPAGGSYTAVDWKLSTGIVNMTTTGLTVSSGITVVGTGAAVAANNVWMVAN